MPEDQAWFEMREHRRRRLDAAAWIPLRAIHKIRLVGRYGYEGHIEEFHGAGTIAVPLDRRSDAARLGWMDVGISHDHRPYVDDGRYVPADQYLSNDGSVLGTHLVLQNGLSAPHERDWIVHPDLVLGFRLVREGDVWLSPDQGYDKVIELLRRGSEGSPQQLSIKAEYLKDFLAARGMALYVTSYRSRRRIVAEPEFSWTEEESRDKGDGLRWEGRINEIHEGGMPFGGRTAVFHSAHADFDSEEDVPVLPHPSEGKFDSDSWVIEDQGRKVYLVSGELWREEWVEPGASSPHIRGDAGPSTASFVVDAAGTRRDGDTLTDEGRWLWFKPDVIPAIAHRRGGSLSWYTRDTGGVCCIPSSDVHFGVNRLGLVTVYAKDIGYLPDWQQRIWAASNVSPDGGVAEELQAAQVTAAPANTQAPEAYLAPGLELLAETSLRNYGISFVRSHDQAAEIMQRAHRFRAVDRPGLFALAKDLARLTADLFDVQALHSALNLSRSEKVRSLKAMERVAAEKIGASDARTLLGPLVGIYELRLGDAHLPPKDQREAFHLAGVDESKPLVHQGCELVHACVNTLYGLCKALEEGTAAS